MRFLKYISIATLIALGIYFIILRHNPYQEINGKIFGTYYHIKIRTENKNRELPLKIKTELDNLNKEMSVFEPDSEINRINETKANQSIELSKHMSELLSDAQKIYQLTNGNFDPTVAPLIELWGFGTAKQNKIPTDTDIKNVLQHTGLHKIKLNNNNKTLLKKAPHITLNLSAIAKGYAVDCLKSLLEKEGYNNFVIEIGGEVYASGTKSDTTSGWNIGIAAPIQNNLNTNNAAIVRLYNMAVATSGDYQNYYYKDNKRYSHTISPHTGYPVEHNLASVTIFDKSCMIADALATGIMVMGEKAGMHFVNQHKIAAIFFVRDSNNQMRMLISNQGKKLLQTNGLYYSMEN